MTAGLQTYKDVDNAVLMNWNVWKRKGVSLCWCWQCIGCIVNWCLVPMSYRGSPGVVRVIPPAHESLITFFSESPWTRCLFCFCLNVPTVWHACRHTRIPVRWRASIVQTDGYKRNAGSWLDRSLHWRHGQNSSDDLTVLNSHRLVSRPRGTFSDILLYIPVNF